MDESRAISHLRTLFPYKSEAYLRAAYRRCNRDMSNTIRAVNNDRPDTNVSSSIFRRILSILCCCVDPHDEDEENRSSAELVVNEDRRPRSELPGVHRVGHQNRTATNQDRRRARSEIPRFRTLGDANRATPQAYGVINEDRTRPKRDIARFQALDNRTRSRSETRLEKVHKVVDQWEDELDSASQYESAEGYGVINEHRRRSKPDIPRFRRAREENRAIPQVHDDRRRSRSESRHTVEDQWEDELDSASRYESGEGYREQARLHMKRSKDLFMQAKRFKNLGISHLAIYSFEKADEQRKLHEQANNLAAAAFLAENQKKHPDKNTIDLHHLFVKEAIQALDSFLDDRIFSVRNTKDEEKPLMVVTGRGKHSANGIPKIKPAVMKRLERRRLEYNESNPGLLKVYITEYSLLTNELT